MLSVFRLGGGMFLLIAANVLLGSIRAALDREWNARVFFRGVGKGALVSAAFVLVYLAGWLNPDLVVAEFDGQEVSLVTAVHLLLLGGFGCYAVKVLAKLKELITAKKDPPALPGPAEDDRRKETTESALQAEDGTGAEGGA